MFTLQAPEVRPRKLYAASMLNSPAKDEERQEIVLHNDPEDFRCFLWFLHVEYAANTS